MATSCGYIGGGYGNYGGGGGGPITPPAGQPPLGGGAGAGFPSGVGNAFLGFHLFCAQATMGKPVNVTVPAACVLYFLGFRLGSFPVLADISASGIVIAGSVTAIAPVAIVGGAGPAVNFAFSGQGWACLGGGGAIGTVGKAFNIGPITGGDLAHVRNVLNGWSVTTGWQGVPALGAQGTANSSGAIFGPTLGTPGWSLSATYSYCGY